MRKGFLWAAGVALVSFATVQGQDAARPMAKALPNVVAVTLQQPTELPKGITPPKNGPTVPEAIVSFEPQPERNLRFWVSADYLLWWVKGGPTSAPIVTTSNNFADTPPSALGQPGTSVLYGDGPIGYGSASGFRIAAGVEIREGLYLEGSYFLLSRQTNNFSVSSDATGSPMIGISYFNPQIGMEDALLTANPDAQFGIWTGTASVVSRSRLQGYEFNLAAPCQRNENLTITSIVGFRALCLNEDLSITNQFTPTIGGALTFNGNVVPAGTQLSDTDFFGTSNHFYGRELGARAEWKCGAWSASVVGKIAFGATQQIITIDGSSGMVDLAGNSTTAVGGIYAQNSNIGRYYKSTFAVVPEIGLNLGLAITERLTAKVGYNFIYWSRVARPGNQIDHNVHETQVPTHQFFGQTTSNGQPAFQQFRQSDFWAQGINFGFEFVY